MKTRLSFHFWVALSLLLAALPVQAVRTASVLYAKPAASGTGDCSSWANACILQTALTVATSGDEIWAAAGTYKPTTVSTDRTATFHLKSGVALYGGFAGTETARDQRNPAGNLTVLSGDIDNNDSQTPIITDITTVHWNTNNSYHVVTGATGATLDGFTITAGKADGSVDPNYFGGGMFNTATNLTLTNVTFSGNVASYDGGGMYNSSSNPALTNVTFSSNWADYGGGMYISLSSPTLTNVTFSGNWANYGGGMFDYTGSPTLTNVTFNGNFANQDGGGMYNYLHSNPTLTNVTFSGNVASFWGAGIYNRGSNPTIRNTIFWADVGYEIINDAGNSSVSDSVVQGGCPFGSTCTNIISTDPKLGTLGNYGGFTKTVPLQLGSSAIDAGNDAVCPATDQRGVSRPQGAHCDMGAYEMDTIPPTVVSSLRLSTNPTSALSVDFTVTFSEAVTGVDAGDFTVNTSGITGTAVTAVTGSGATYTVTVNTGVGNGTLRLNLIDNDTILDLATNPLGGPGAGNGSYIAGNSYIVDKTVPAVVSSLRASPNPTNAYSMDFTVAFSEAVTGVDTGDFSLATSGLSDASIGTVSGSGTTYTVSVNTGTGDGTLRLDVSDNDTIRDAASNPLGGTGAGNGNYTGGQTYTVDKIPPSVVSSLRASSNPTHAASVDFSVTFSEAVTGVDTSDFSLATSGITGASITTFSGSGTTYTVSVNTGTGDGTLRLDVIDNDTILDLAGNPLGGAGGGNGNYTGGQTYTVDKTAPTVASSLRANPSPNSSLSVDFNVTFSEAVTGVDTTDFSLNTSGITGASVTSVSGSGTTYTVSVNTGTGNGTIRLDVSDNDSIVDLAGNPLGEAGAGNGNYTGGQTYTMDKDMPTVLSSVRYLSANPNNTGNVYFTVTFSTAVTGVDVFDFGLHTTGVVGASVSSVSGSGTTYHVNINTGLGSGTLRLEVIDDDSIIDAASNPLGGVGAGNGNYGSGESYSIDKIAPHVTASLPAGSTPTNASSVNFNVTFSEAVTGVIAGDFSLHASGVTGAAITGLSGSGTAYTVSVDTGTGNGTIRLDVVDDDTILDLAGNPLGGADPGNGDYTSGLSYTIDRTFPTVLTSLRAGTNPTSALSVDFAVTFSEAMTGVNASDFTPNASGITGASVTNVGGTGTTYTITVNTGIGSGTLQLDVTDDDSILDLAGNPLGGTGAGNGNHSGDQFYTVQKTEIRWFIGLGLGNDSYAVSVEQSVADDFNALHPAIHLTLEVVDSASAPATLATEIAAGTGPDLIGPMGWLASNNLHGESLDLAALITSTGFDTSIFNPRQVSMYQTDDGQVSLPFSVYPSALFYNPALFDIAGLNYPPAHYGDTYTLPDLTAVLWDWNTLTEVSKLLTLDSGGNNATQAGFDPNTIVQYGFSFGYENHPNYWGSYWHASQILQGTPGAYTAVVPAAWKAAWEWLYGSMWGTQPFIPNGSASGSLDGGNVFASGKVAMLDNPSWYYTCCMGDLISAGGTFQMGAMSAYNGGVAGRMDADTFRIWKDSLHPDAAFTALSYLVTTGVDKLIIGSPGNPPAYPLMLPALTARQPDWLNAQKASFPFVTNDSWNILTEGMSYPDTPNAEGYVPNYDQAWDRTQDLADLMIWDGTMSTALLNLEITCLQTDLADIFNGQPARGCLYVSGDAGVGGATLSFEDNGTKTATADGDGDYFFIVPNNWTGIVTPSKAGYTFTPDNHSYTSITTNQAGQDYTASLNTYLLSLSKAGTGSGTVTSSSVGIDCGSDCSETYDYNTSVTLTAGAATGSTFTGWSGEGCSGTGTCVVTMCTARLVTADFALNTYLLSVSKTGGGSGTVSSAPDGIDCGSTCSHSFDYNTSVTLTAAAATGSTFSGWSGSGCSGTSTCTVNMDAAKSVTADFIQNEYTLTITSDHGTVTKNPSQATYHEGDVVQLIASPNTGWSFANWSGGLISTVNPDSVTIHGNTSVTANYTQNTSRIYLPLVIR